MTDLSFNESGIYQIRNVVNGKSYIGSAICLRKRLRKHKNDLKTGIHHSEKLQRAWTKYGEHSFVFSVIELVSVDQLISREQHWLDLLKAVDAGYNICRTAGSILGIRRSEETKAKMSRALKGRILPPLSEKHRQRISETQRGRVKSLEERKNISLSHMGKKLSEEHKRNLSRAVTGFEHTDATKAKVSAFQKGRVKSAQERANISAAKKGAKLRPLSAEHRARISASSVGRKQTPESIEKRVTARRKNYHRNYRMHLERAIAEAARA